MSKDLSFEQYLEEDEDELELTADPFTNDSDNYDGTSLRSDDDLGVFNDDELEDTCEYVNDDDDYAQEENYD